MAAELLSNLLSGAMLPSDEDSVSSSSESSLSLSPPPRQHRSSRRKENRRKKYSRGSYINDIEEEETEESGIDRRDKRSRKNRRSSRSDTPSRSKKKTIAKKRGESEAHNDDTLMNQIEYVASEHAYYGIDAEEGMEVSVLTMPTVLQNMGNGGGISIGSPSLSPMQSKSSENAGFRHVASLNEEVSGEEKYEIGNAEVSRYTSMSSLHHNKNAGAEEGVTNIRYGRHQWPCDPTSSDYDPAPVLLKENGQEAIDEPPAMRMWKQKHSNSPLRPRYERGGEVVQVGPEPVDESPMLRTAQRHFPQPPEVQQREIGGEVASLDEPPVLRTAQQHSSESPRVPQRQMGREVASLGLVDEPPALRTVQRHFSQPPEAKQRNIEGEMANPEQVDESTTLKIIPQNFSEPSQLPQRQMGREMTGTHPMKESPALRTVQQHSQGPQGQVAEDSLGAGSVTESPAMETVEQNSAQPPNDPHRQIRGKKLELEMETAQQCLQPTMSTQEQMKECAAAANPAIAGSSYISFSSMSVNGNEVEMSLSQPTVDIVEPTLAKLEKNTSNIDQKTTLWSSKQNRFAMPTGTLWPSKSTEDPKPVVIQTWASEDAEDTGMVTTLSSPPSTVSAASNGSNETSSQQQQHRFPLSSLKGKMAKSSSKVHPRKLFSTSQLSRKSGSTRSTSSRRDINNESRVEDSIRPTAQTNDGPSLSSPALERNLISQSASYSPVGVAPVPAESPTCEIDHSWTNTQSGRSVASTSCARVLHSNDHDIQKQKVEAEDGVSDAIRGGLISKSDGMQFFASTSRSNQSGVAQDGENENNTVFRFHDEHSIDSELDCDEDHHNNENMTKIEESCPKYFSREIDDAMTNLWSAKNTSGETRISLDDPFDELKCASNHHYDNSGDEDLDEKEIVHELVSLRSPTSVAVAMFDDLSSPDDEISHNKGTPEYEIKSQVSPSGLGADGSGVNSTVTKSPKPISKGPMEYEKVALPKSVSRSSDEMTSTISSDHEPQFLQSAPNSDNDGVHLHPKASVGSKKAAASKSEVMASNVRTYYHEPSSSVPGSQYSSEEDAMVMSFTSDLTDSVAFSKQKFTPSFASKDISSTNDCDFSVLEDETMTYLSEGDREETATSGPFYSSENVSTTESTLKTCARNPANTSLHHDAKTIYESSGIKSKREFCESSILPSFSLPNNESKTTVATTSNMVGILKIGENMTLSKVKNTQCNEATVAAVDKMPEKSLQRIPGSDKTATKEACQILDIQLSSSERNNSPESNGVEKRTQRRSIAPSTSTPSSISTSSLRRMRLAKALAARGRPNRGNQSISHAENTHNPLCSITKATSSIKERRENDCSEENNTVPLPSTAEANTLDEHRTNPMEGRKRVKVTQVGRNQSDKFLSAGAMNRVDEAKCSETEIVALNAHNDTDDACATSGPKEMYNDAELSEIVVSRELPDQELSEVYGERFLPDEEVTVPSNSPTKEMTGNEVDIKRESAEGLAGQETQLVLSRSEEKMEENLSTCAKRKLPSIHIDPNGMISEKAHSSPMMHRISMPATNSIGAGPCNFTTEDSQSAAVIIQRVFRGWRSCYHLLRMMGVAKRRRWEPRRRSLAITRIHSDIRRKARASLRERARKLSQEQGRKVKIVTCCMAIAARRVCAIQIQRWWLLKRWSLRVRRESHKTLSISRVTEDFLHAVIVVIQASIRGYIQRNRLLKEKLAATKIQALFRCYRCWKHFNENIIPKRVSRSTAEIMGNETLQEGLRARSNKDASNNKVIASSADDRTDKLHSKADSSPFDATLHVPLKDCHLNDGKTWIDLDPPLDSVEETHSTSDVMENSASAEGSGCKLMTIPSSATPSVSGGSESSASQNLVETGGNLQNSAWDDLQENFRELEESEKRPGGSKKLLSKRRGVLGKIRSKFGGPSSSFLSRSSAENNSDRLVDFFGTGDGLSRPTPPLPDASSISLTSSMSDEGKKVNEEKNVVRETIPRAVSPSQTEQGMEVVGSTQSTPTPKLSVKDPAFLIRMRADNFMEELF